MKLLIRFALILAGSATIPAGLFAQTPGGAVAAPPVPAVISTNGMGPRIQFNTENYDAGTNLAGDPIKFTFLVTNTGDETLVLSNVKPSCGCTTVGGTNSSGSASTWSHEIAPGQSGIIPIQIVTGNLRGPINKTVTVTSNDRTRPTITLNIRGVVWLPIEVAPQMASLSLTAGATNLNTQALRIFNRMDTPLELWDPQSTTNAFSAVLKTNVPGQEFELTITSAPINHLPASLSMTVIQGEISLKSSATNKNPLVIPVFETITPEITIYPPNIQLPSGPLTQAMTNRLTIRGNTANLALSDPVVNAPGVQAFITVMQTNRIFSISVAFPQGFEARPGQNIALTLKTDNPRFPTISIPVSPVLGLLQPMQRPVGQPMRTSLLPPVPRPGLPATNAATSPSNPALRSNTLQP